jgi:hypothetical protein
VYKDGNYWGDRSCTTDDRGKCKMTTPKIGAGVTSLTFSVDDVTHTVLDYEAADNADPDGDSGGTTITVARPW